MLLGANALADRLFAQGDNKKGLEILGGVLDGLRELRGDRHPDTVSVAGYLAQQLIKFDEGNRGEVAESLAREAYENAQLMWGYRHTEASLAASTLAQVLERRGKIDEAEQCMRLCHEVAAARAAEAAEVAEAAEAAEAAPGGGESGDGGGSGSGSLLARQELQVASSNLAQILLQQDRPREALPYARGALEASTTLLGTHHPDSLDELRSVGRALEEAGEEAEAEECMRVELERSRDMFGSEHPRTLLALSSLARLLGGQEGGGGVGGGSDKGAGGTGGSGECEAEALMREDVSASKRVFGPTHQDTLAAISNLAQLLYKRERFEEALPHAREALRLSTKIFGAEHEHSAMMARLLASTKQEAQHEAAAARAALEDARQASMLLLASWPKPGASWAQGRA